MKSNVIFFIGMPGVGKSTIGSRIAQQLNYLFTDLDNYIASKEGKSVVALIADLGIDGFRKKEAFYLRNCLEHHGPCIIACGGGTPCFHDNIEYMKTKGFVVLLCQELSVIATQIQVDNNERPLLKKAEGDLGTLKELLNDLWEERKYYYQQAHVQLMVDEQIDSNFVTILEQWNK